MSCFYYARYDWGSIPKGSALGLVMWWWWKESTCTYHRKCVAVSHYVSASLYRNRSQPRATHRIWSDNPRQYFSQTPYWINELPVSISSNESCHCPQWSDEDEIELRCPLTALKGQFIGTYCGDIMTAEKTDQGSTSCIEDQNNYLMDLDKFDGGQINSRAKMKEKLLMLEFENRKTLTKETGHRQRRQHIVANFTSEFSPWLTMTLINRCMPSSILITRTRMTVQVNTAAFSWSEMWHLSSSRQRLSQ